MLRLETPAQLAISKNLLGLILELSLITADNLRKGKTQNTKVSNMHIFLEPKLVHNQSM